MAARILGPGEITAEILNSLIGTEEGQTLDFKRAINLEKSEAKRDLAADISAFANESGGDIVFGMDQTAGGIASQLVQLSDFNLDRIELQFRHINQAQIEPAVAGLRFVQVEFEPGQFAMVLRIPRSWNRPHAVAQKNSYTWHIRDGRGNRSMKPRELREAFNLSAEISERMKKFRGQRIQQLSGGTPPVPLSSMELLVLHVLPISAFDSPVAVDLAGVFNNLDLVHPLHGEVNSHTLTARYNFDGVIAHRRLFQENDRATYYTQVFRDGCIESVNSHILEFRVPNTQTGISTAYEVWVEATVRRFLEFMQKNSVETPIFVMLSMINVRGRAIGWLILEPHDNEPPPGVIDRNPLLLPEVRVDSYASNYYDVLKPAFDVVWQSCGRAGSVNYTDGNWSRPSDEELERQVRTKYS